MAKALDRAAVRARKAAEGRSWGSRMSDHVAFALLTYTGLQIFITMMVLKANHLSILPYLALVVLVIAVIPAASCIDKRWSELPEGEQHDPRHAREFARDRALLWATAILLPLVITGLLKGASQLL